MRAPDQRCGGSPLAAALGRGTGLCAGRRASKGPGPEPSGPGEAPGLLPPVNAVGQRQVFIFNSITAIGAGKGGRAGIYI